MRRVSWVAIKCNRECLRQETEKERKMFNVPDRRPGHELYDQPIHSQAFGIRGIKKPDE
jgi:hypothetical protein